MSRGIQRREDLGKWFNIPPPRCTGEFRGGKIWGNGLMTYSDGTPSSEGYFQETKFRSIKLY